MNHNLGTASAIVNACAVAGFALCMITGFLFGSYLASMFIALSFVPMICAFAQCGKPETKAAGYTAMIFAGVYATFILMIYFAQVTTVRLADLTEQASALLDYQAYGLFFNLNLLGYGMMSLSTFFAGLTVEAKSKPAKALKYLLMIHGVFAISCFVMPMLGVFSPDLQGVDLIGTAILLFWCAFFLPVGMLSYVYFKKGGPQ